MDGVRGWGVDLFPIARIVVLVYQPLGTLDWDSIC